MARSTTQHNYAAGGAWPSRVRRAAAALTLMGLATTPLAAIAAESDSARSSVIEEVIVTAQKREQNDQTTVGYC